MDTDRQKEREKARPMLGPQKLPTKDFTQTWTPVRGSEVALKKVAAAPCRPDICCLTDQLHGCFSPSSGRACVPLPEQLSDARSQEVREADAGRETLTLPDAAPPLLHPLKSAPPLQITDTESSLTSEESFPPQFIAQTFKGKLKLRHYGGKPLKCPEPEKERK